MVKRIMIDAHDMDDYVVPPIFPRRDQRQQNPSSIQHRLLGGSLSNAVGSTSTLGHQHAGGVDVNGGRYASSVASASAAAAGNNNPTKALSPSSSFMKSSQRYPREYDILLPANYRVSKLDVMNGRGRKSYNHIGNRRFRKMIAMNLKRYSDSPTKLQKTHVVVSLVMAMRDASPYGGFLKKDPTTNRWISIGDTEAREKVGHCLRDMIANSKEIITDDNDSRGGDSDNNLVGRGGVGGGGELILFEMDGGNGGIGGKSTISKKNRTPYGITSSRGTSNGFFGDDYDSDDDGYGYGNGGDDGNLKNKKIKRLEMSIQQQRILQAFDNGFNGTVQQLLHMTAGNGMNNNLQIQQEEDNGSSSSDDDNVDGMEEDENEEDDSDTTDDEEAAADEKMVNEEDDGEATSDEKEEVTKEVAAKSKAEEVNANPEDDIAEQQKDVKEKRKDDKMDVDGKNEKDNENPKEESILDKKEGVKVIETTDINDDKADGATAANKEEDSEKIADGKEVKEVKAEDSKDEVREKTNVEETMESKNVAKEEKMDDGGDAVATANADDDQKAEKE